MRDITYSNDPNGGTVVAELKQSFVPNAGTFITKFDANGAVVWSQPVRLARANTNLNYAITVEDVQPTTGGYYVAGWLPNDSTVTFGTTVLTAPATGQTLYRAFLSESGAWQTGVIATFSSRAMQSMLLRTDASGTVYVAGLFGPGTVAFGSQTVTVPTGSNAALEYVVAACNPGAGGWTWATVTTTTHELLNGIPRYLSDMTVKYGTVWITGIISGSSVSFPRATGSALTLLPGGGTTNAGGNRDVFLAAASGGSWTHASNFVNDFFNNGPTGGKVAIDGADNVYITGYSGSASANGVSSPDGNFIAAFNPYTSRFQWAKAISYAGNGALACNDSSTGAIVSGDLSGSATFGATTLTSSASVSGYVSRITSAGIWQWAVGFGGANANLGHRYLNAHFSGAVYIAGEYNGSGLTLGSTILPVAQNGGDIFLAKLTDTPVPTITTSLNTNTAAQNMGTAGDNITITGTNLTGATSITFTGTTNSVVTSGFTVNAAGTQITGVIVPGGARTGLFSVSTPGGMATSPQVFTVISTWTGAVSTDWATPSNWQGGSLPTITERALIPTAVRNPLVSGNQVVGILGLFGTGVVTIADNSSLSLYGDVPEGDGQAGLALVVRGDDPNAVMAQSVGLRNGVLRFVGANRQKIDARNGAQYHFDNVYVGPAGVQLYRVSMRLHGTLTLTGDMDAANAFAQNNKPLVLMSDAVGTALVANSGGQVLGPVTVQRYIDPSVNNGPGYRHYSSPVTGNTLADLATPGFAPVFNPAYNSSSTPLMVTPFPTVYGYNQSRLATTSNNVPTFDKGWFSPVDASSQPNATVPGIGYSVHLPASETVDFVGALNSGNYSVPLVRGGGPEAGWQLVGNPYPAPLDYSLVAPADRTNLDAAMYVFESTASYSGTYRSYVNGVGDPMVASSQGFFVRVSAGQTSGTLTFRNSQRLTQAAPSTFRRGAADTRPQLQLALAGTSGLVDGLVLYMQAGATAGMDAQFDAVKLHNSTGLNLAAVATTGEELAIDGRPVLGTSSITIPLAVAVPAPGTYHLRVAGLLNLPATMQVELLDNLTGQRLDLRSLPAAGYTFPVTAAQAAAGFAGRFFVAFNPGAAPLAANTAALAAGMSLYPNPAHNTVTVLMPANTRAENATLTLTDALGRIVQVRNISQAMTEVPIVLDLNGLPSGMYTLLVRTGAAKVVRRLVVE
ncbi:T9SS type A sorting domain-containing protein [Hymenobacter negativus]|uniref:T9SS type A sorting domain-containing protein n=1 Tax=Hymenobacter negativus TaxID=2795026 RepID=A0ABS3QB10_9BACT|nr:T9SS type A sorting domain-containing protein [Hymenobacter negativus]MBO2007900.1 T9SS type A sorting domain-containing protein [Hymenobacter negativus]